MTGVVFDHMPNRGRLQAAGRVTRRTNPRSIGPRHLYVATGTLDDPRQWLAPDHKLFPVAWEASRSQHEWSDDFHRGFWTAVLRLWPRPAGPRPTRDRQAQLAEYGRTVAALTDRELAKLLVVEPATIRRKRTVERGDELERRSGLDSALRSEKEAQVEVAPRLPCVYADGEEEPEVLLLPAVVDPTLRAAPDWLRKAQDAADEGRRAMWASGELVYVGSLICRRGADGLPDICQALGELRRLLTQDGSSEEEAREIIEDAQERGKLPRPPLAAL